MAIASWNVTSHWHHGNCHWYPHAWLSASFYWKYSNIKVIWLVVEPTLWKIWVRQLGWWHSQYNVPVTTNQLLSVSHLEMSGNLWWKSILGGSSRKHRKVWTHKIPPLAPPDQTGQRYPHHRCTTFSQGLGGVVRMFMRQRGFSPTYVWIIYGLSMENLLLIYG